MKKHSQQQPEVIIGDGTVGHEINLAADPTNLAKQQDAVATVDPFRFQQEAHTTPQAIKYFPWGGQPEPGFEVYTPEGETQKCLRIMLPPDWTGQFPKLASVGDYVCRTQDGYIFAVDASTFWKLFGIH